MDNAPDADSENGFLSTPSARRATHAGVVDDGIHDISIHALREEGDLLNFCCAPMLAISIHALREEGDENQDWGINGFKNFYPRPPRGGRRTAWMEQGDTEIFLSTPSARRATLSRSGKKQGLANFYPRPPRGGRQDSVYFHFFSLLISIHALREEGDHTRILLAKAGSYFYPRPPRGGRQVAFCNFVVALVISIHALREEGDTATTEKGTRKWEFLSTPSARRATTPLCHC